MIQTIGRKGKADDLVANYDHVVVDECHHLSAHSFEMVARQCRARYFTGLSATVVRKYGHHPIIFMNCGPVRYKVDEKLQAAQRPFDHRVITRSTEFRLPTSLAMDDDPAIQEIYGLLETNAKRNEMIAHDVIEAVAGGRFPLR